MPGIKIVKSVRSVLELCVKMSGLGAYFVLPLLGLYRILVERRTMGGTLLVVLIKFSAMNVNNSFLASVRKNNTNFAYSSRGEIRTYFGNGALPRYRNGIVLEFLLSDTIGSASIRINGFSSGKEMTCVGLVLVVGEVEECREDGRKVGRRGRGSGYTYREYLKFLRTGRYVDRRTSYLNFGLNVIGLDVRLDGDGLLL